MVRIENLSKEYKLSRRNKVEALKHINAEFGETGFVCIVGKSGCGKTTFLNCLGTLDDPTEGKVYYKEADGSEICLTELSGASLDRFRNSSLGVIYQDYNLISEWTVEENLQIVFDIQKWESKSKEDIEKRIKEVLEFVELDDVRSRYIKELSGGQQQRVAIARAIIKNPRLLLADEPTGNLDSQNSELIMKLLKKCSETCLVLMVTHDTELASKYADRIIRMQDGEIRTDAANASESESDGKPLTKRPSADTKGMSFSTVFRLAFHSLRIKKLKMFFSLLAMVIVICVAKPCLTFRCNDVGKAASEYLQKNHSFFLYAYEKCTYLDRSGIEGRTEIRNRNQLKEILIDKFGAENCYSVIENAEAAFGDEELECRLVVSGIAEAGNELSGKLPEQKNEIVITDYLIYKLGLPENCIGTAITCNGMEMKITGIVDVGVEEYLNAESENYWMDVDSLYTKGSRLIVAESYPQYLAEQKEVRLPFAGLSANIGVEEEMESVVSVSSVSAVSDKDCEIISGRLPENASEAAVSALYAEYCLFVADVSEIEEDRFGFLDIHNENQNDVFNGYLALYDIMPDVKIVGIIDGEIPDIIFTDSVYDSIITQYSRKYYADSYEIVLTDETAGNSQIYSELYEKGVSLDMEDMETLYDRTEEIRQMNWVYEVGLCVTGILLILLLILFFSFNVKDNHVKIGILKSLGVSDSDIAKIWVTEALIVTGFTWIVSFVVNLYIFGRYNSNFRYHCGYLSNLIHHNVWTEGLELLVLLALTVATVIMPIWVMTDKKPTGLIRSRS